MTKLDDVTQVAVETMEDAMTKCMVELETTGNVSDELLDALNASLRACKNSPGASKIAAYLADRDPTLNLALTS